MVAAGVYLALADAVGRVREVVDRAETGNTKIDLDPRVTAAVVATALMTGLVA